MSDVMRQAYRALSEAEKDAMQKLKADAASLYDFVISLGSSRELSTAKTKIEEAVMWAVKHITGAGIEETVMADSGGGTTTPPTKPGGN